MKQQARGPMNSLFPIPYSLFPIPYSLFPIPYSLFPIPYSPQFYTILSFSCHVVGRQADGRRNRTQEHPGLCARAVSHNE
jgi:hypothetical protein